MKALFLILLMPVCAVGQSVSVSPVSMKAWGKTPSMSEIQAEYKGLAIHYFHSWRESPLLYEENIVNVQGSFGLSYSRSVRFIHGGVMYTGSNFPIDKGTRINFMLGLHYDFGAFTIEYRHYSNGLGLLHDINPGVDFLSLRVSID